MLRGAFAFMLGVAIAARAETFSLPVAADTFVSSSNPGTSFGTHGAAQIAAPTPAQPRTLLGLLRFDTASLRDSFDAGYGAGNWSISSVSLTLFSSVNHSGAQPNNKSFNRIAAGDFDFGFLSNDDWEENSITWNSLSTILPGVGNTNSLTPLGTFFWNTGQESATWSLAGDVAFWQDIYDGSPVSFLGQPTPGSGVSYLFNTQRVNPALLNVTVQSVPEPSAFLQIFAGLIAFAAALRRGKNPAEK